MRLSLPKRRPLRIVALAGTVIAFVLVTTGALALLFPNRAAASSSSLEILDGVVALSHDGTTFTQGRDGDLVQQGDVVRTGSDSHAVLTFFDGSTIEVEPDSELIVHTLRANSSGDILMTMQQNFGRSWHVVSRALTPNSKYEVKTPTATATVRGTAFLVSVATNGRTNVQTTEGVVHAIAGGEEIQVPPGYETNVNPGGTPPDAATLAPPPPSVMKIIVDQTPNATVTDASKRTVGVLNGLPVRYVPGSTVQVVDGKLVITIPNPTLGRLDTHVQPADNSKTDVDVNVQVHIGGNVVGNVTEHRNIDTSGVAKGGVVITGAGTYVVPDADAKKSDDPRIGKLPPPPTGGLTVPFSDTRTPAPTAIVSAAPDFIPRFNFDPRLTAKATDTPAGPSPSSLTVFNGGFQPFVLDTRTVTPGASATPTPAPNSGMTIFTTTVPLELSRLTAATPTPDPTLNPRLTTQIIITAPTATPEATFTLRTIDPVLLLPAAPTLDVNPRPILPGITLSTPTPAPLPSNFILRTLDPSLFATPTPVPTDAIILRPITPIILITAAPTPEPTPPPTIAPIILRTIAPIILITAAPTPEPTPPPTIAPIIFRTITPIILITAAPTPEPTPPPTIAPIIFRTISPIITITAAPTPAPTPAPTIAPFVPIIPIFIPTPAPPTPAPTPICFRSRFNPCL